MVEDNDKITFEEHKELGRLCKIFNDKLIKREVKNFNQAKSKVDGRKITKHENEAIKSLNNLRNHLEEIMFKNYPKEATTDIYYGER